MAKHGRVGRHPVEPGTPVERETSAPLRRWSGVVGVDGAERADSFVAEVSGALTRSQIKARGAVIRADGREIKPSRSLKPGQRIEVEWREEPSPGLEPEDIPLSVLYEDGRCIVLDKPQGMVTHPGHGNRRGTLANALLGRLVAERSRSPTAEPSSYAERAAVDGSVPRREEEASRHLPVPRAGIVHRLDKDTSGVIIAAKDVESQEYLAAQFKDRLVRKEYLAITRGIPPAAGRIADRLGRDKRDRKRFARVAVGGKVAVTDYRVLASWSSGSAGQAGYSSYALVALKPKTGRTHQLRVHLATLGTPILGDPIYEGRDRRFPEATLMLHAYRLRILLPGATEPAMFRAPLPKRFLDQMRALDAAFGKTKREEKR